MTLQESGTSRSLASDAGWLPNVDPISAGRSSINPGPTDTGWMSQKLHDRLVRSSPIGRVSTPTDAANVVGFLLSGERGLINAECIDSEGGFADLALSRLADPV